MLGDNTGPLGFRGYPEPLKLLFRIFVLALHPSADKRKAEESSRRRGNSRGCSEKPTVSGAKRKERGLGTEDGKDGEERLFAALQNREQFQGTVSSG